MTHRLTGGQPPLTGGPTVVRRWSTAVDQWSGGGLTVVRGTVHMRWQVRGGRYEVVGNVRWQYEVAAAGQSEHDMCPKRVFRGCQACVSPRLSCGDPRQ
ncbi:hypothetical protein Tco_0665331 [Tanacetum coccineum]